MSRERVSGVALALVAVVVLVECWRSRLPLGTLATPGPAYAPVGLALLLLGAAALLVASGGRGPTVAAAGWGEWRHAVAIVATCVFVALALERLGYRVTMALASAFLIGVVERKGPVPTALVATGIAAGTYYLFDTLLRVQLPRGPFGL
jgi:hypothetical protein